MKERSSGFMEGAGSFHLLVRFKHFATVLLLRSFSS